MRAGGAYFTLCAGSALRACYTNIALWAGGACFALYTGITL